MIGLIKRYVKYQLLNVLKDRILRHKEKQTKFIELKLLWKQKGPKTKNLVKIGEFEKAKKGYIKKYEKNYQLYYTRENELKEVIKIIEML